MAQRIHLGISTCPNDTFAFHGILTRSVDMRGLEFDVELLDIRELNSRLFAGEFDVAKASFHAGLHLTNETLVLPSGSALGFGNGPLLLAARPNTVPDHVEHQTLCPGKHTTAHLLFRLFYPSTTNVEHVVFSDIMPMLQRGEADFGVCIHEGRFTWESEGLSCVEDLGKRWEVTTNCPLPLGGILARRSLGNSAITNIQSVIRESLQQSLDSPEAAMPTMRKYAQEFEDDVLMQHVELYVNDWTVDLGSLGRSALDQLSKKAREIGLLEDSAKPFEVFAPK